MKRVDQGKSSYLCMVNEIGQKYSSIDDFLNSDWALMVYLYNGHEEIHKVLNLKFRAPIYKSADLFFHA